MIAALEAIVLMFVHSVTFNCKVLLPTQPSVLVPLAEYVVLTLGETAILLVLIPPDQVYVLAPFAVKVMFSPMHIVPVVPLIVILGSAFTFTLSVFVEVHPKPFVPTTEYVVVIVGVTTINESLSPIFQT